MAVNVKMGVDIGSFKQGIREGQQILKSLDAEMKVTEAEFKATGNAEKQMADKTRILTSQMNVQKGVIDQIQKAMKRMTDAGVQPTDQAYQKLNLQLLNAQAAMMGTQAELNSLSGSEQQAASSADKLATSVGSIGKKLSLDQVISGIDKITGAMENALKAAVRFGEQIWDNIMESAQWGDDIATQAAMAQMSIEKYQQVMFVAQQSGETSTSSLIKSWKKVKMNLTSDSDEVTEAFKELGVSMTETYHGVKYEDITKARDYMDVYWEIGEALMNMTDSAKQERLAQTLLGRSWQESIPMFLMGREAYEKALDSQDTASDESVQNLAELNDAVKKIEGQFTVLKAEMIGQLAPAFKEVADVVGGLLGDLNAFLKTEEGQAMLQAMADALKNLFSGIKDISAEDVMKGFTDTFNTVLDGIKWIAENKDAISAGITAAFGIWGTFNVADGVLSLIKLFDGMKTLFGNGKNPIFPTTSPTTNPITEPKTTGGGDDLLDKYTIMETVRQIAKAGIQKVGEAAYGLAAADPTGVSALIIPYLGDKTAAGRALRDGEGVSGALAAGMEEIQEAAGQAVQNWVDYGVQLKDATETIINSTLDFASSSTLTDTLNGGFVLHLDADELSKEWQGLFGGGNKENEPELPVRPELPEDAQQQLQNAMDSWNPMKIYVMPIIEEPQGNLVQGHANGLPWVPFDGYAAILHRGERVLTARENKSYTYNNNNYFGSVNLNNGLQVEALAESLARQNQRQRAGYGA